jgi:hypothetical protein
VKDTDPDALRSWAESEQDLAPTRERAARIAKSMAPVTRAVAAAAGELAFEAEPSGYQRTVAKLKETR